MPKPRIDSRKEETGEETNIRTHQHTRNEQTRRAREEDRGWEAPKLECLLPPSGSSIAGLWAAERSVTRRNTYVTRAWRNLRTRDVIKTLTHAHRLLWRHCLTRAWMLEAHVISQWRSLLWISCVHPSSPLSLSTVAPALNYRLPQSHVYLLHTATLSILLSFRQFCSYHSLSYHVRLNPNLTQILISGVLFVTSDQYLMANKAEQVPTTVNKAGQSPSYKQQS